MVKLCCAEQYYTLGDNSVESVQWFPAQCFFQGSFRPISCSCARATNQGVPLPFTGVIPPLCVAPHIELRPQSSSISTHHIASSKNSLKYLN